MTTLISRWSEHQRENLSRRPFWCMVRLFSARMFHGGGDNDSDELDLSMGLIFGLLALPGGFVSILLFNKYGSLLHWMRGEINFDPYAAAMPDEYFFIVLSMVVTGTVAVWRWDSIFPDRRDYMNLVPLPIRTRNIFFANLVAVLYLAGLLALDVNAASAILFPAVVSASQETFTYFARFALAHTASVAAASIFTFLTVFSVTGCSMALLPVSIFRKISPCIRGAVGVCLLILLSTSSVVPSILEKLAKSPNSAIKFLPSGWFLGLSQRILGRANPASISLSHFAVAGLGLSLMVAILAYTVSYRRYFIRIPELAELGQAGSGSTFPRLYRLLDRFVYRTPFQRGCGRFVLKTLLRSERHRLTLAAFTGLALVIASQVLLGASGVRGQERALSTGTLSVPFRLVYCAVLGLRLSFDIPVELRASWTFRLLVDPANHESDVMARNTILLLVLSWMVPVLFTVYAVAVSWKVALLHACIVAAWCLVLTEVVLIHFRKLPFACAFPSFEQNAVVVALMWVVAFVAFADFIPDIEHWALSRRAGSLVFVPIFGVAWYALRRVRQETLDIDKNLIFEEASVGSIEMLHLRT